MFGLWSSTMQPITVVERTWRKEIPYMLGVAVFAFAIYFATAPRLVALEDDGLFLMNLEYFGIPHPSGYPLFVLLGGTLYHLMPDFIEPAFRGHLVSGIFGALACAGVYAVRCIIN